MIRDGPMGDVSAFLALHVDTSIPVGVIGLSAGPAMVSIDKLDVAVLGRSGNGAGPAAAWTLST
jgi:metal-dependent amidase/aminoacylase/carboxypeptidase family protein